MKVNTPEEQNLFELRCEVEVSFAIKCMGKARADKSHKCDCPDPWTWTADEVISFVAEAKRLRKEARDAK